jgi:hypothetical protein
MFKWVFIVSIVIYRLCLLVFQAGCMQLFRLSAALQLAPFLAQFTRPAGHPPPTVQTNVFATIGIKKLWKVHLPMQSAEIKAPLP